MVDVLWMYDLWIWCFSDVYRVYLVCIWCVNGVYPSSFPFSTLIILPLLTPCINCLPTHDSHHPHCHHPHHHPSLLLSFGHSLHSFIIIHGLFYLYLIPPAWMWMMCVDDVCGMCVCG